MIPEEVAEGEAQCPIFVSPDINEKERCVVLIQGAGDVRAGVWARSVTMNDTLTLGSVLPQLDFAREYGCSAIVFNPNFYKDSDGNPVPSLI